MQLMLPDCSWRYSANESAISFPLEPGGLISKILSTKTVTTAFARLTFRLLELLDQVLNGVLGPFGDEGLHEGLEDLVELLLLEVLLKRLLEFKLLLFQHL